MTTALEQIATTEAAQTPVAEVAAYLARALGTDLTALVVRAEDVATVERWAASDGRPDATSEAWLRAAYVVTRLLTLVDAPATVRAWFLGQNPLLDDASPAALLSEDAPAVLQAARHFAAVG